MSQGLSGTMQVTGFTDNPLPLFLRAIAFHFSLAHSKMMHSFILI